MRVRCVSRDGSAYPEEVLDPRVNRTRESRWPLTVGREYVVQAVTVETGMFWYYLIDDDGFSYPTWYCAAAFEISDARPSSNWVVGYHPYPHRPHGVGASVLAFREWADDPHFYERLYDDDPAAVEVFDRERRFTELEDAERNGPLG